MNPPPAAIFIPSRAPFAYERSLAYFRRRAGELVDATDGDAYRRLLVFESGPVLIEARPLSMPAAGLSVKLLAGPSELLSAAAEALRRCFGLDDDLQAFRAAIGDDTPMAALVDRLSGLRLVRTQSPFEAIVWAVIGQQINLTFAFRLKSSLVRGYGVRLEHGGKAHWAFPRPAELAAADPVALAATGLTRRKAETIVTIARQVASGALDLESLRTGSRTEAEARLVALPGIGPWTAHYALLRGLGDFGAFPAADLGLRVAVARTYGCESPAPPKFMRELAARWGEWRGYAAFYLWNALAERAG